jgi:hypothetical protein
VRTALTISALAHVVFCALNALADRQSPERQAEHPIIVDIVSPEEVREPLKLPVRPEDIREPLKMPEKAVATEASQGESPKAQPPSPQHPPNQKHSRQQTASAQSLPPALGGMAAPSNLMPDQPQVGSWLDSALGSPLLTTSAFDAAARPAGLSQQDIASFKAHLAQCWNPPASVANAAGLVVILRVFLDADGALSGEPTLLAGSASSDGPALIETALRALRQCQPYNFLPPEKYADWKALDLSFSPMGLRPLPTF